MNNDLQDKRFLALELTKISFNDKTKCTQKNVFDTYSYFLLQLTDTLDKIDTISSLITEITKLREENKQLKDNNRDVLEPFCETLLKILDDCKGDMEPYVYKALRDMLIVPRA